MKEAQLQMKHCWWNAEAEAEMEETIRYPSNFPYIAISSSCKCNWRRWQGRIEHEWNREVRVRELCKKRGIELWNSEDGNGHNFVSLPTVTVCANYSSCMHACSQPELTDVHSRSASLSLRAIRSKCECTRECIFAFRSSQLKRVLLAEKYAPHARFVPVIKLAIWKRIDRQIAAIVDISSINKVSEQYVYTAKSHCTTDSIWILKLSLLKFRFIVQRYSVLGI